MEQIRHEMAGYRLPAYVEDILTANYCPGFMRMSMIRESDGYVFNYRPGVYRKLNYKTMSLYEKLLLINSIIDLGDIVRDHLINPESYLLEPELVYFRDESVMSKDIRIMYYPDVKALSFRFKIVLFADRILDKQIREERNALDQIRQAAEGGDVNRIKLSLDKQIMRLENRMTDSRIFS